MKNEEWRPVPGYEDSYEVSNTGRVRSLPRASISPRGYVFKIRERILRAAPDGKGYLMVWLYQDGKRRSVKVARLVAEAFIPNPENKSQVDHINAVKHDNRVENLRWVTGKENFHNPISYKRNAESKTGILNHRSKRVFQYTLHGELVKEWPCVSAVEKELGFSHSHISQCCCGLREKAYGYLWRYL